MKDVYDEIVKQLKEIKDKLVIVEGVNDKRALQYFGVMRIKTLSRRALYKVVEEVKDKEVVLLVDLDKAGKKLYSYFNSEFSQRGVKIDNKLREYLFRKTKLRQIEGLKRFMERTLAQRGL